MINLGLSSAELRKLRTLLVNHHRIEVSVQLLDLSHRYLGDVTDRLLGGQVDVDADADGATRSCTMDLLDPKGELHLDGNSPDDGSIYFNRMVKIVFTVVSVDRQSRYRIPIFVGPLSKVDRNGPVVTISATGKEKLAMSTLWKGKSYKAGAKKTDIIKNILVELANEQKYSIPTFDAKIPKKMVIGGEETAWSLARKLALSMSKQLFYDGRGVAILRSKSSKSIYTFRASTDVLSNVTASFDAESVINCVQVIGGKPKKAKKKITYRVVAPRSHVLSPYNMGRWGKPRYLPEVIEDDGIRSKAEARRVAKARLKAALVEQVEVAFDSLPIPFLEEGDWCRVVSNQYTGSFRMAKFSIPLTAEGAMSVGYLKRVTPSKRYLSVVRNTRRNKPKRKRS